MTERRRDTRRRLLARAWGWWLARFLFVWLALYSCLFLLQSLALLGELRTKYGSLSLEVEPVAAVPVGGTVVLRGRAPAWSGVEVAAQSRVIEQGYADARGRFEIELPRSPWVSLIRVRAFQTGGQRGERTLLLPPPPLKSYPLTVDLAAPIAGRLWMAGQGPPAQTLRVEADGQVLGEARPDHLGIYDVLLPVDALPREVSVVSPWGASPAAAVSPAPPPLARTADLHWTPTALQTNLRIDLPVRHPYFLALSAGSLPFPMFVERVFGGLLLSDKAQPAVAVAGDRVEIRCADEAIPYRGARAGIWAADGRGIGSAPLLTGRDRVTLHFGKLTPWLVPPLPVEVADGRATWRGPLAAPPSRRIVLLGRDPASEPEPREPGEPAERKLRELVQRFEEQVRVDLLRHSLWALIALIPFLAVLLLSRRAGFGGAEIWRGLAAAAAILAVWRSWELLLTLIGAGPGLWLTLVAAPAVWGSGPAGLPWSDGLEEIHANAFWLVFVTLIAMVPLYFDDAVRAGLRGRPWGPPGRRGAWGRVLAGAAGILSAALFAAGLAVAAARWGTEVGLAIEPRLSALVAEAPWWTVLAFAGLAALPLVAWLLRRLAPLGGEWASVPWLVSAALIVLSLFLPRLPTPWVVAAAGALMVAGLGWIVVRGLPRLGFLERLGAWADRAPARFLAVLFAAGLVLAWPLGAKRPGLIELRHFALELGEAFPYLLAAGLVLVLLEHARGRQDVLLPPRVLAAGGYLYAVFLLNSSSTWLFVPIAFLTGLLLAGVWLFRPAAETDRLAAALPEGQRNPRLLIQSVIDATELGSRFRRIRQGLTEKLESMELKPREYEERLAEYRDYLKSKASPQELPHGLEPRELVFAVGEPTVLDNTATALRWGAVLALGPLLVAVYQYLPSRGVSHAFPVMDLLTFLGGALASWLLYAFLFGYFFVHLRGNSGLAKGCHLFGLVAIPFALYHLLHASTLGQVRPFLLWLVQLFLFFTLLGLLAFDYGLLRRHGFRFKDLRLVHDMPALSAYASTVIAAVVPAVTAVVTGEAKDLVSFFLETILPRVPS